MSKIIGLNSGLDQHGAEPIEQQQFGTAGVKPVNVISGTADVISSLWKLWHCALLSTNCFHMLHSSLSGVTKVSVTSTEARSAHITRPNTVPRVAVQTLVLPPSETSLLARLTSTIFHQFYHPPMQRVNAFSRVSLSVIFVLSYFLVLVLFQKTC